MRIALAVGIVGLSFGLSGCAVVSVAGAAVDVGTTVVTTTVDVGTAVVDTAVDAASGPDEEAQSDDDADDDGG